MDYAVRIKETSSLRVFDTTRKPESTWCSFCEQYLVDNSIANNHTPVFSSLVRVNDRARRKSVRFSSPGPTPCKVLCYSCCFVIIQIKIYNFSDFNLQSQTALRFHKINSTRPKPGQSNYYALSGRTIFL